MDWSTPGFPVLYYVPEFAQLKCIESMMPLNNLLLCHLLFLLPSIFPSIRVFSNELALHIRWPKYWSFSFSIRPFNEYSGSILFKIDLFDLLGVQGILKSLIQHHSWKGSILQCSAFFMVQHSHPYTTTGKTTVLGIWTFVGKVMSVLFNTLSRFGKAFLTQSKALVQSMKQKSIFSPLEFLCFFYDLMDIFNLISSSSAFPKSSFWSGCS